VAFSLREQHLAKTIIYIDGYNLYYSRLKGTPHKWLDVVALFRDHIVMPQNPQAQAIAVKFFTSPVKASYARHGQASEHAQTQYHRALQAKHGGLIQIIKGFHIFQPSVLPSFLPGEAASKEKLSPVWMIEEKQTDVNLALHAYRDAIRAECEQLVICSNDSDVEPALRMIRDDVPKAKIGLVMPLRADDAKEGKVSNKRLTPLAHWVRHHIRDDELAASQLPINVSTKKKPASKPAHW
jgi:uncharacterized LabA/DUF88 family protein